METCAQVEENAARLEEELQDSKTQLAKAQKALDAAQQLNSSYAQAQTTVPKPVADEEAGKEAGKGGGSSGGLGGDKSASSSVLDASSMPSLSSPEAEVKPLSSQASMRSRRNALVETHKSGVMVLSDVLPS